MENARRLGADAMIVTGGEGTQHIARDFFTKGVNVVGAPKTIDNDLDATEVTFGFDTAVVIATEAIDCLHTTAESHHRAMFIEGMGRDAGWRAHHPGPRNPLQIRSYLRRRSRPRTSRQALYRGRRKRQNAHY
jgi:ATP-dependent phosphofructokinase / diphosphate-dependent phosphofructokinase